MRFGIVATSRTVNRRQPAAPGTCPDNRMGDRTSHGTEGGLETVPIQTTPEADRTTGVIPAAPWRIKALSVLPDYRLAVTFIDDTKGIADFSAIPTATECGVFEALKDQACFDQACLHLGVVT